MSQDNTGQHLIRITFWLRKSSCIIKTASIVFSDFFKLWFNWALAFIFKTYVYFGLSLACLSPNSCWPSLDSVFSISELAQQHTIAFSPPTSSSVHICPWLESTVSRVCFVKPALCSWRDAQWLQELLALPGTKFSSPIRSSQPPPNSEDLMSSLALQGYTHWHIHINKNKSSKQQGHFVIFAPHHICLANTHQIISFLQKLA